MEEWKEYKLGDFMDFNPIIKLAKNTLARKITMDQLIPHCRDIYSWTYEPYSGGAKFENDDTIMARITPCLENGKHAFVSCLEKNEVAYGSTEYIVMRGRKGLSDNCFVYYLSRFQYFKNAAIKSMVGTSGRQRAQVDVLKNLKLRLPAIFEQKKIASVLSSLDDKIDCNRRINDNLEQQAKALFKSWFVDFEPFKDGEFVESELGMIPKGWKVGKLGELCQFKRGKNLLSKDAVDGGIPVVAGGLEPSCYHNVSNTKSPVVTVSGSGANAGFMRMYHQEVWASDCSFIDSTCDNLLFVYCFLATHRRLLRHAQTGAVQPHVKPADIHDFDIVIPPADVIVDFQKVIAPSIQTKGKNEQESRRLAQLRDTLLPKLMSGKLKTTM